MSEADPIRDWLRERLAALLADLEAGRDVSPARRLRLEGALECWARQRGLDDTGLMDWLRECGVAVDVDNGVPRLELTMERAPVYPSTQD